MTVFAGTRIGEHLHQEHRSTLDALYALENLLGRRAPTLDGDARATLESLARALEDDVTGHFGFEEEHLFPVLRQAGAAFMVDMLTAEHAAIRPLAEEVRAAIDRALAAGAFDPAEWPGFESAARELIDRETFHIQKEEMGLLGALAQVLEADIDRRLAEMRSRSRES